MTEDLFKKQPSVLRILLIEDDPDLSTMVRMLLEASPKPAITVDSASSMREALSHFRSHPFDAILMDLGLPDSQGLETVEKIRSVAPFTPLVVFTGEKDDATAMAVLQRGAQDYIIKGTDGYAVLVKTLRFAIERNRISQELNRVTDELKDANKQLEMLSLIDPLTELYNRRGLQSILTRELKMGERSGRHPLVIILDLDNFKGVNDSLGYSVGDVLLKEVAHRLKGSVRMTDYVARIGGDEFMVILPQTRMAEGMQVAEKIRLAVSNAAINLSSGNQVKITASVGVGAAASETPSIDELLAAVGPIVKLSKRGGKNRVSWEATEETKIAEPDLDQACDMLRQGKEIYIVKQPIVRLQDSHIVGYEFLGRCSLPSITMPDVFFRLALERNMLTLVDHYCFKSSVEASKRLSPEFEFHINLFPSTIIDIPIEHLLSVIETLPDRQRYCIEISEQQIIGEPSYLLDFVNKCREKDIRIAIDDIGFGHSCLESLIILEPDIVKIDRSCIHSIGQDEGKRRRLSRMLGVIKSLDAKIIAEGVESEADLAVLKDLGVDFAQGYLFGKPDIDKEDSSHENASKG